MDAAGSAAELHRQLVVRARPERSEGERRYLKSDLTHLGVPVPSVRSVARQWVRVHGLDHDSLLALADALWAEPVHERRLLAIELTACGEVLLDGADVGWVEAHLRDCGTWALVDPMAGGVLASVACRDERVLDLTEPWALDDDVWIRRSAVLVLRGVLRDGRGWDRFVARADVLADDPTFWVRKALGWVAREQARRRPADVSAWVTSQLDRLSAVTIREPTRVLPDGAALLEQWRTVRTHPRR